MSKTNGKKGFFGLFSGASAGGAMRGTPLTYDWRLDGESAVFGVDMTLCDSAPMEGLPVLAYVSCFALDEGEKAEEKRGKLSPAVIKGGVAFAKKCVKLFRAEVAGYIETETMLQYYFYLPSLGEYDRMKTLAAEERAFECRIGGRSEPDWDSYFSILCPDEAKMQTVHNGAIIEELYKSGDSETPRRLNLHLAFPTEAAREAFASEALAEGFATGEYEGVEDGELPCGVVVHRICAMKKWDVDAVTVHAIRIAERYEGRLLYWDCPIVPRRI